MTVSAEAREFVRRRAADACEYCRFPTTSSVLPHQVDHIIGRQHRGSDDVENLCLCCIHCNLKKGPNIASIDPETRSITPLYHPRQQPWFRHFKLSEFQILGLTAEGRATVTLLNMNAELRVQLRQALVRRGWSP